MIQFRGCVLVALICLTLGCSSRATPADLAALEAAREAFSDSFEIDLKRSIYIEARHRLDECPRREIAESLYQALLMDGSAARRESSFVYLNLWDARKRFCYQLAYDPSSGRIEVSHQPYY